MSIPSPEARVAEFVRQYRMRNDASPDGVIYNVWMDVNAEQAELRLDDLEALTAAAPSIQAAALRDAADTIGGYIDDGADADASPQDTMKWLRARADQLEKGAP